MEDTTNITDTTLDIAVVIQTVVATIVVLIDLAAHAILADTIAAMIATEAATAATADIAGGKLISYQHFVRLNIPRNVKAHNFLFPIFNIISK